MIYESRLEYVGVWNSKRTEIPLIRYRPCIKYRILADPEIDGTDTFIVAESMKFHLNDIQSRDPDR